MKQSATVKELSDDFEELVHVSVGGCIVICFIAVCQYRLTINHEYLVRLNVGIIDDLHIREVDQFVDVGLENITNTYAYRLVGIIDGSNLIIGQLVISLSDFASEILYLDGKRVELYADRIEIEFI